MNIILSLLYLIVICVVGYLIAYGIGYPVGLIT